MNLKLFFRNLGHWLAFPYVISTLWISIQICNRKAKDYQNNPDFYPIDERFLRTYKIVKKALFLFNIKINVTGFENVPKRPVMYIPNHKSNIDPLIFIKLLYENEGFPYYHFVAKKEMTENKLAYGAAVLIDCLFLDRKNPREIIKILLKEEELIKKESMVVFLEGKRIEDADIIGEIKSAGLAPAINNLTTIVPVALYGTLGVMTKNEKRRYGYKEIDVSFLKPIKHTEYAGKNKEVLAERIRETIEKEYLILKKRREEKAN
ncbi:MAG: lysophospholipid acyltransferase family protein [Mycoplasmoidaceae bacterium]